MFVYAYVWMSWEYILFYIVKLVSHVIDVPDITYYCSSWGKILEENYSDWSIIQLMKNVLFTKKE